MTLDEVRDATREAAGAARQLADHLDRLRTRLDDVFPLDSGTIGSWGDEQRERLHALLRIFEQLYDLVGRKLLRGFLSLSGEDATSLSARNAARRVEGLGALPSADRWLELGTTRNRLIHDYPITSIRQAEIANAAWDDIDALLDATHALLKSLSAERLI